MYTYVREYTVLNKGYFFFPNSNNPILYHSLSAPPISRFFQSYFIAYIYNLI